MGNVIGANVFNLVLVSDASVALAPFAAPTSATIVGMNASLVMEILVMFTMLLLMIPPLRTGKLSRWSGITLRCIYAAFCVISFAMR